MPDVYGWPTALECISKLNLTAPDPVVANLEVEVIPILAAKIAEFQSPVGEDNMGGTGRRFTPVAATRLFDGSGHSTLLVDDIVPGSALSVSAYGTVLPDVLLSNEYDGLAHNTLVRPTNATPVYPYSYGGRRFLFPKGIQNISVTTTWGFAATVPIDINEAIRCEVAYEALITGVVGLNGVGEEVEIDGFQISTAVGAMNWARSSPLGVFHDKYLAAVKRYRIKTRYAAGRQVKRMY